MHSLLTQEREFTCEAVIKGKEMMALIDTAASVSLIREERHKGLRTRGWLRRRDIELSQADGKTMTMVGMVRLPVKIGGMNSDHKLYVIPDEGESKKRIL